MPRGTNHKIHKLKITPVKASISSHWVHSRLTVVAVALEYFTQILFILCVDTFCGAGTQTVVGAHLHFHTFFCLLTIFCAMRNLHADVLNFCVAFV